MSFEETLEWLKDEIHNDMTEEEIISLCHRFYRKGEYYGTINTKGGKI